MLEWIALGADPLPEDDTMQVIQAGEQRILLARVDGRYYAVQPFCSHLGANLLHGRLDGHVVSCPRNASRFDLRDGRCVLWLSRLPGLMRNVASHVMKPKPLRTYPIRHQDGQLWVQVG